MRTSPQLALSALLLMRLCFTSPSEPDLKTKVCETADCLFSAYQIVAYRDITQEPCADFYAYACGNYTNAKHLDSLNPFYFSMYESNEKTYHQFLVFVERYLLPSAEPKSKENTILFLRDFYGNCSIGYTAAGNETFSKTRPTFIKEIAVYFPPTQSSLLLWSPLLTLKREPGSTDTAVLGFSFPEYNLDDEDVEAMYKVLMDVQDDSFDQWVEEYNVMKGEVEEEMKKDTIVDESPLEDYAKDDLMNDSISKMNDAANALGLKLKYEKSLEKWNQYIGENSKQPNFLEQLVEFHHFIYVYITIGPYNSLENGAPFESLLVDYCSRKIMSSPILQKLSLPFIYKEFPLQQGFTELIESSKEYYRLLIYTSYNFNVEDRITGRETFESIDLAKDYKKRTFENTEELFEKASDEKFNAETEEEEKSNFIDLLRSLHSFVNYQTLQENVAADDLREGLYELLSDHVTNVTVEMDSMYQSLLMSSIWGSGGLLYRNTTPDFAKYAVSFHAASVELGKLFSKGNPNQVRLSSDSQDEYERCVQKKGQGLDDTKLKAVQAEAYGTPVSYAAFLKKIGSSKEIDVLPELDLNPMQLFFVARAQLYCSTDKSLPILKGLNPQEIVNSQAALTPGFSEVWGCEAEKEEGAEGKEEEKTCYPPFMATRDFEIPVSDDVVQPTVAGAETETVPFFGTIMTLILGKVIRYW